MSRERAELVIQFIETYLYIPEGAFVGQKVVLRDWQKEIIYEIYAPDDPPVRRAIISFARKNAKTALLAMLILAHLVGPVAVRNAQIYSAALSRDQASVVFELARKMVLFSPELSLIVHCRPTGKELLGLSTGAKYKSLSAAANTAYGLSPVFVVYDELGQVVGPSLPIYDALETAMGAQANPLSIIISTQAPTDADMMSVLIDDAKRQIALGDHRTKLFLYAAEEGDDIYDEATWKKANPALGDFRSLSDMRESADRARRMIAFTPKFQNLFLNMRRSESSGLFSVDTWDTCGREVDDSVFDRYPVFLGLDLSSRRDMTALAAICHDLDEDEYHLKMWYWKPAETLSDAELVDKAPYRAWADMGYLEPAEGPIVNFNSVTEKLIELNDKWTIHSIAYDRWRIDQITALLQAHDVELPLLPWGQGWKDSAVAIDAVEDFVMLGQLRHGNHPILRWNVACTKVMKDPSGNRKFDRRTSSGRIDGIVAASMACGAANLYREMSAYQRRGAFDPKDMVISM